MTTYCQAPKKNSKWKYYPEMSTRPHFGYARQGINTFDAGLRLLTFGVHENISLMGNAIVFKQNATYVSPEVKIRYVKPLKTKKYPGLLSVAFSVSYWTSEVHSIREHRITPEISVGFFQYFHLCYGYNIPISTEKLLLISPHRFAIRFISF